ncbi:MAG: WYL domain-containing protein [Muribaculaceae bacterium]|nr:WYL domain-containing protein [Muribaculaceae bacterium]
MARETVNRCVWLVDTIRRYGRITRRELDELWLRSSLSDGKVFSRRTFYNYRDMIEELFSLRIECNTTTYEYYIAEDTSQRESMSNWMLNSLSLNNILTGSREVSDRIFVEDIPSSREHLGIIVEALKGNHPVRFDYHSYTRSLPRAVVIEPYFIKLFKQRWYLIGRVTDEDRIKTYALDRMKNVAQLPEPFKPDPTFDAETYFRDAYGIVVTQNEPRKVVLKTDSRQAKYLAALPLHHSQSQTVADGYSLFTMKLRITDDFVEELLSHGPRITVLEPPELRARMKRELSEALEKY